MATVKAIAFRRFVFLSAIVARLRLRNSRATEADALQLLRQGHYLAAVLVARFQLESAIRQFPIGLEVRRRADKIVALKKRGVLSAAMGNQINRTYRAASNIAHGQQCSRERAKDLVTRIESLISTLALMTNEGGVA